MTHKRYMTRRSPVHDIVGLTALGIGTGLGAKAISSAGGDASGLSSLSSFQPVMGTLIGTKMTLRMISDLDFNKKRRRY